MTQSFLRQTTRWLLLTWPCSLAVMMMMVVALRAAEPNPSENKTPPNPTSAISEAELTEICENLELLQNYQVLKKMDFLRLLDALLAQIKASAPLEEKKTEPVVKSLEKSQP